MSLSGIMMLVFFPFERRFHMKFEENWSRDFRAGHSKVWTDGRKLDDKSITIAHPEPSAQGA